MMIQLEGGRAAMSKASIIDDIMCLGYSKEKAEEIMSTFEQRGGLCCLSRWPEGFSFFCGRKNVLDVLLEHKVV